MVDDGYKIDFTRQITDYDDMLADRFYVSGRKLAQYNNIIIDQ